MARTILDITRLLTRAAHPIATGVDRVELAYARHALKLPIEATGFAAVVGKRVAALDRDQVAAFVAAIDAKWSAGSGDDAAARRLAERLGASPPAHASTPSKGAEANRLALKLRLGVLAGFGRFTPQPQDVYLHVSHLRLDRPEVFEAIRQAGAALVVMVHDLIPIRFPEYGRAGEDARHARRMATVLRCATAVIANSDDTARDLAAYAAETGVACPPVIAAPLGVEPGFTSDTPRLTARKPYFVSLGTIEPRKNHLLLLHLWRRLDAELGDAAPTLVLVGRRGWENEMVVDLLERSPAIRRHVVEVNDLPDAALVALTRGARALLFPSFAEGYGLPLAEALALGAPVIASDLAVFRELAGDAPDYLDPLDATAWAQAVRDFSADTQRREAALNRLAGYSPPRWDQHFETIAALAFLR